MATDEHAPAVASAPAPAAGGDSQGFSFSIWPPTQRTRDAVVRRLVDTLAGDTILCKRYGAVPAADAEPAARAIEAEAFDAAAATGGAAAASVEEGIEALQFYSKEVSRRLLDFVKSRSAAAKAEPPTEAPAAAGEGEAAEPQPARIPCDSSPLASSSSPRGSPERNRGKGLLVRVKEAMEHKETGCQAPVASSAAMEHKGPILCINNCGFFGSAATMNMCSKCHKGMIMKQEQAKLAASSIDSIVNGNDAVKEPVVAGNAAVAVAQVEVQTLNVQPVDVAGPSEGVMVIPKGKEGPNRCNTCRKRVGLTGFNCRCGNLYCALHRYSDKHDCKFDYRTAARDAIAKANPLVKAEKLDKI